LNRAVVRVPNWLGDSIMARPFVAALVEQYSRGHLLVVAHRRVADLWRAWPGLWILECDTSARRALDMVRLARAIRRHGPFDHGYLLTPSLASALEFAWAGVRERCGFAGGGRGWVLTDPRARTPRAGHRHDSLEFFRLLRHESVPRHSVPAYRWPESSRQSVARRLKRQELAPGRFLVLAMGAAGEAKRYAPAKWQRVLARVTERWPVVLVGTAAERPLAEALGSVGSASVVHDWCGTTSLPELAVLLESAAGFAGVDSGAAHLAASVNCPTTVVFGPGDPIETEPAGPVVDVIRVPLWCAPCRRRHCMRRDHPSECLDLVPPDRVADAVLRHAQSSLSRLRQSHR
jgi:heptosyltransferase-2